MSRLKAIAASLEEFITHPQFDESTILRHDQSWPKITIVTPSFNQGAYLEKTILSVLNQNYPNLEYIIMDGGSEDGSVEIIRKYSRYLSHWSSEPDNGQSAAIAKGFSLATGEYLAWINSDDIYFPNVLYKVGETLKQHKETDIVSGNMFILDANDNIVAERRLARFGPYITRLGFRYGGFGMYQPASFWSRRLYDEVGGLDTGFRFCMDTDLFIRLGLKGRNFKFIRAAIVGYRIHRTSKTSTLQDLAATEFSQVVQTYNLDRTSLKSKAIVLGIRMCRVLKYFIQGDGDYLIERLKSNPYQWVP